MKGRCKTGHVQHSEASVPPRCWLSPTSSRGQPGSGRRRCGSPAAPGTTGTVRGAGTARPSRGSRAQGREPRVGHGTFLLRMGGEQRGAQGGRVGWTGHVGLGWKAMGQSREGTAVLPSLGPDGIAGVAPAQGHGKGVPSLHRDMAKVSLLPWQCCSWVTGPAPPAPGSVPRGSVHCPPPGSHGRRKAQARCHRGHCPGSLPAGTPGTAQHSSPAGEAGGTRGWARWQCIAVAVTGVQCSAGRLEEAVSASQGCSRVTELS